MTQPAAATNLPDGTRIYTVPVEGTGELVDLPNITGIIGLADPKHLCDYRFKIGILGAALRDDIRLQIAAANLLPAGPPRNAELRRVGALAETAGGIIEKGYDAGDRGTALHSLTERLDELVPAGEVNLVDELGLPKDVRDIACEYVAAMAGVVIVHTEVTVASFTYRYAGTGDRLIRFLPLDAWRDAFDQWDLGTGCFVLDNKFGKTHLKEAGMQLAAIANAETIWDAEAQTHAPLPDDLRRDVGFIFNPDKGLIPVPLEGAIEAFRGLVALKHYRDGTAPLNGDVPPSDAYEGMTSTTVPPHPFDEPTPKISAARQQREEGKIRCARGEHCWTWACTNAPGHPGICCGCRAPREPVHIAEVLPKVIEAIPEADPFAGLPDEDGRPQADRNAKRAWLIERIDALRAIPGGVEQVAKRWPAVNGVTLPTFPQSTDHTLDQLDLIAKAITAAEAEVRAPLRGDDPTDPRTIVVANDDPRVLDVVRRLKLLPPDLLAAVEAEGVKANLPRFASGRVTEANLAAVGKILAAAEAEYAPRAKTINDALAVAAEHGVSEASLCAVLGVRSPLHIHGHLVGLLNDLADAINHPDRIVVERDGVLVVDQPTAVLAAYGDDRTRVWRAGQQLAKANGIESPKDSEAVLSHPLLAAALAAV